MIKTMNAAGDCYKN